MVLEGQLFLFDVPVHGLPVGTLDLLGVLFPGANSGAVTSCCFYGCSPLGLPVISSLCGKSRNTQARLITVNKLGSLRSDGSPTAGPSTAKAHLLNHSSMFRQQRTVLRIPFLLLPLLAMRTTRTTRRPGVSPSHHWCCQVTRSASSFL